MTDSEKPLSRRIRTHIKEVRNPANTKTERSEKAFPAGKTMWPKEINQLTIGGWSK